MAVDLMAALEDSLADARRRQQEKEGTWPTDVGSLNGDAFYADDSPSCSTLSSTSLPSTAACADEAPDATPSRTGAKAAGDAVLSVVRGRNARLIAGAARLYIGPGDHVLDMTYGRGLWWTEYRPGSLVANDIDAGKGVVHHDYRAAFRWPHYCVGLFDVVAFDPPYISTGPASKSTLARKANHGTSDFRDRFGLDYTERGWQGIKRDVEAGMSTAWWLLKPGGVLMVKCCDYVESGHKRWGHKWVVDQADRLGLDQVDEFIHDSGTGPQPQFNLDGSLRQQKHARRAHSFLCVFRKAKR